MGILKNRILAVKSVFILLVVLTALVIFRMFFDKPDNLADANPFILWVLFTLAGLGLVIMVKRAGIHGKVKGFLLTCAYAAVGFLVGVVLHNLFYALGTLVSSPPFLTSLLGFLDGSFFILAVIVCPLALLVGCVGTLVLWREISTAE